MSSILDIKKRLERHRDELQHERQAVTEEEAPAEERETKEYVRKPDATRDIGMDELLREIKSKEQKHMEELKDEIENLDDLKDLLTQMIKEGEEHITTLDSKLERYNR